MSLINTMLEELEKNDKGQLTKKPMIQPSLSDDGVDIKKEIFFKRIPWQFLLSLLLLVAIIVLPILFFAKPVAKMTINAYQTEKYKHRVSSAQKISSIKRNTALVAMKDANTHYQHAVILIRNQNIPKAITELSLAVKANPEFQKARETLVVMLIQVGKTETAMDMLNQGLNLSPGYLPFIKLKAHLFTERQQYQFAINLLINHMPFMREDPGFYALLAAIYYKDKKYMTAAGIYFQLTHLNSNVGDWWYGLGSSLQLAGKERAAKEAYRKALLTRNLKPRLRMYLQTKMQKDFT